MLQDHAMKRVLLPALNEAERRRFLAKDGIAYGAFIVDARGNVVAWGASAERLFAYRENEILGKHFSRLFFRTEEVYRGEPEHELRTAELFGRSCADRWYVRKDGTAVWCHGITAPLLGLPAEVRFFVKVLRDATEMKRLNTSGLDPGGQAEGFDRILTVFGCGDALHPSLIAQLPAPVISFGRTAVPQSAKCRN
jgi:PAS domain S-box-containing protein